MIEKVKVKAQMPKYSRWLSESLKSQGIESTMDSLDILLASENSPYLLHEMDLNLFANELMKMGKLTALLNLLEKYTEFSRNYIMHLKAMQKPFFTNGQIEESLVNYKKVLEINPYSLNAKLMVDSFGVMILDARNN